MASKSPATRSRISDTKTYSLLEIVELGVLGKSHHTVRLAILHDRFGANILKAGIKGSGKGARYFIFGTNLKEYLQQVQ
jgi:hypothetical protein